VPAGSWKDERAAGAAPRIAYHELHEFPGWDGAPRFLSTLIEEHRPRVVLEAGSGANPTLPAGEVGRLKLRYITSDIEARELEKAPDGYETRCLDLEHGPLPGDLIGACDLVFSRMVNEHVRDGEAYHRNLYRLLAPRGLAAHCFSTLYALPFLANRLAPGMVADLLLDFFNPRDRHQQDKFRAHYSWSRGPSAAMLKRFRALGYEVLAYDGYFGHPYYQSKLCPLDWLERLKSRALLARPIPLLTAYATVILRKP